MACGVFLSAGAWAAEPAPEAPDYQVLTKAKIGGEGRWDYLTVDEAGKRLFLPRSNRVTVLDLASEDLHQLGEIAGTDGVHGVALAPKLGRGFTSNGKDNNSTIFDLKTLKVLGKVPTGANPDAIAFDPTSGNVFTMNHRGGSVTAFKADADVSKPIQTTEIPLGGTLEYAVVDGAGHLYVNVEDKNEVVAIDTRTLKVTGRWPLGEGEEPTGLAMDVSKGLLFAVCHNEKMVVLESQTGRVVATLPIGKNVDGCAFDPERQLAFSSNGDGTLTLISDRDAAHPAVVGTLKTQTGARTIAIDTTSHRLYLPTAEFKPAPADQPNGRPAMIPGTFTVLVVGQK